MRLVPVRVKKVFWEFTFSVGQIFCVLNKGIRTSSGGGEFTDLNGSGESLCVNFFYENFSF